MKTRVWQFDHHGDPSVLALRTEELSAPGPGQALVRMRAIGLNNSEARYVAGRYAPPPRWPTCLGHEGVGEIVALGPVDPARPAPRHTPLEVGARVALLPGRIDVPGMGSYRELGVHAQQALAPVPDGLTDAEGAALWMGVLTAGGSLLTAGLTRESAKGKRVVVTAAASGMGIVALQLARAWGANTVAVTRSEAKREKLAALADRVVVCPEPTMLAEALKDATEGKGFDVALDPVGAGYVQPLITAAAPLAHIVIYEMMSGREAALPLPQLLIKDLSISGFTLFRLLRRPELVDVLIDETMRLGGALRPVVAQTLPFEQAPEALRVLAEGAHLGKLVMTVS